GCADASGTRGAPVLDRERGPSGSRRAMDRARPHGHPSPGRAGVRLRARSGADRGRCGGLAPRVSGDAPDRSSAPGRKSAAMNVSGPVLAGVGLGLMFGVGLFLLVGTLPWLRPRDLGARVEPYLRRSRSRALFAAARSPRRLPRGVENLLGPVAVRVLGLLERLTGGADQLERRLRLAGRRTSADSFRVEQVVFGASGLVIGVVLAVAAIALRGTTPLMGAFIVVLATVLGVLLRDYLLGVEIKRRAAKMAREFPTVADLLALAVAAGESPIAAMERVARTSSGALPDEFAATVADIRAGTSVSQALVSLGARTPLGSLGRFGEGVSIAIERGTPLADVLRAQAQDAREEAKRELMQSASHREIMTLFPVAFFVLPLVIVFAIFPALTVLELSLCSHLSRGCPGPSSCPYPIDAPFLAPPRSIRRGGRYDCSPC